MDNVIDINNDYKFIYLKKKKTMNSSFNVSIDDINIKKCFNFY